MAKVVIGLSETDEGSTGNIHTKPMTKRRNFSKPVHAMAQKNVMILRVSVILCIFLAAAIVGYTSYQVLRQYDDNDFEQAYNAVIKQLLPATTTGNVKTNRISSH